MFKVNNGNGKTRCEICSKLNIFHISYLTPCTSFFIVNFKYVNVNWVMA